MKMLSKVWKPEVYQGARHPNNYFEGWYFKMVDEPENNILAIIPGISCGIGRKDPHAFIQVIDGVNCESWYIPFNMNDFRYSTKKLEVWIDSNYFSSKNLYLDIKAQGLCLKGSMEFNNITPWPVSIFSPGMMGPYAFIPFMECCHGAVSLNHTLTGELEINNEAVKFTGGRGYIEKDWGRSFPSSWIWMQSNHFEDPSAYFTASVARIPWFGRHFTGFIMAFGFMGKLYRFTTYTGAQLALVSVNQGTLNINVRDKHAALQIQAHITKPCKLFSPRNGLMDRVMEESSTAEFLLRLTSEASGNNHIIFEGKCRNGGLEIMGDIGELQPQ